MRGCKLGLALVAALTMVAGCDDDSLSDAGIDAGASMDAGGPMTPDGGDAGPPAGRCGNGEVNAGEECDDGNRDPDDGCNADCMLECGDGVVGTNETCDTAIAAGMTGACPDACDDGMACTTDTLAGSECTAECVTAPITAAMNDDGCCPDGETALTDNDCGAVCGNMLIEAGETCEAGVAACPTDCDDGNTCTTDTLSGSAADCDAACSYTDITACSTTSDGCCPSGCDSTTDADCSATCGNNTLEAPELCEDGSATPCPTSCGDGDACTMDVLTGMASMCNVQCSNPPITACSSTSDGCCPGACNETNDADCAPVCGNLVIETGETCDDGNMVDGDGCDMSCQREAVPPTGFRMNDIALRDPHAFTMIIGCNDITGTLNSLLGDELSMDANTDGFLDLSFMLVFRPLDQSAMSGSLDLVEADCTAPLASTSCSRMASVPVLASAGYTNVTSGSCLGTMVGTPPMSVVRPYAPPVDVPTAPCFESAPQTLTLTLSGIAITLREAQVAASYVGAPATMLSNGLIRGFISEADAIATTLPSALPLVGGSTLASVLRGGMGNCSAMSDMDTHPVHGPGWWFFANFPATAVPYTEL